MTVSTVLITSVLALTLAQVGVAWYVYRRGTTGVENDVARPDVGDGTVECPECGAENDAGYRFCGNCVAELPGVSPTTRETPSPVGRQPF